MENNNSNIVMLTDAEGHERMFEVVDAIEFIPSCGPNAGKLCKYMGFLACEDDPNYAPEDEGALVILRSEEIDGESYLMPVEDDDEFTEVGEVISERLEELYAEEEDEEEDEE